MKKLVLAVCLLGVAWFALLELLKSPEQRAAEYAKLKADNAVWRSGR